MDASDIDDNRLDQADSRAPADGAQRRGRAGGALPNLVVIGAQKCGTSGLHYHLGLHPEISMSKPKELNFFIEERNWPRGLDWYRAHFDARATVRGESSPNYTAYPQHLGVPERMHSVDPRREADLRGPRPAATGSPRTGSTTTPSAARRATCAPP